MSQVDLRLGDCIEVMRTLPDNSVDAIVTDPPYGLSFMGKAWDHAVPGPDVWREALRVLKPGGHLLAFAGTRTQHRMAAAIEDAGFEIRDMIAWVYGSGFPKSLDVSKAIDKAAGVERTKIVGSKLGRPGMAMDGRNQSFDSSGNTYGSGGALTTDITAPATEAAQQWNGWGTALKPALEPVTVARKPFKGTVAANVLAHGTGALNVDGCRVGASKNVPASVSRKAHANCYMGGWRESGETPGVGGHDPNTGRWPANLIHDGSDEVVGLFPVTHGKVGMTKHCSGTNGVYGKFNRSEASLRNDGVSDTGSAARFFYCAKASKKDRGADNKHPTVKPTDLMRHLVRLVTPPGGTVLDPFMGSGSTGKACALEGFDFIGIDLDPDYLEIARARIAGVSNAHTAEQGELFRASA